MPLYRVTKDRLEPVKQTSFIEERLLERKDLQRLLKADISVARALAPGTESITK